MAPHGSAGVAGGGADAGPCIGPGAVRSQTPVGPSWAAAAGAGSCIGPGAVGSVTAVGPPCATASDAGMPPFSSPEPPAALRPAPGSPPAPGWAPASAGISGFAGGPVRLPASPCLGLTAVGSSVSASPRRPPERPSLIPDAPCSRLSAAPAPCTPAASERDAPLPLPAVLGSLCARGRGAPALLDIGVVLAHFGIETRFLSLLRVVVDPCIV